MLLQSFLSIRKAKKNKESLWNATSKRLLINFLIPMITGGVYILIKIFSHHYGHTGALMLIFYGLALVNASKYTIGNVKYLGFTEIFIGINLCYFSWICFLVLDHRFWANAYYLRKFDLFKTRSLILRLNFDYEKYY